MQEHVASDPSTVAPTPSTADDLVRAMRENGLDVSFQSALEAGARLHRHMARARIISARMVALHRSERIGSHVPSIGDEAVVAGAVLAMRDTDWVFPGPREWYAALARGLPLGSFIHHAFGTAQDPAKGHAAPGHVPARKLNIVPPSGVIGAHLPQAVGAAWAAKIAPAEGGKAGTLAALALFGAEVASSGDFHNALNFAGVFKAPVVFVCRARPGDRIVDRAVAYGLASARVDGGDALAMLSVVRAAVARAQEGKGATLVEAVVPPLMGLDALDETSLSPGKVRDLGKDDPLRRLAQLLTRDKRIEPGAEDAIADEVSAELDAAIAAAEKAAEQGIECE
ncbi:MAG TPA: thiamine pyrophosphate-dependent enzyme, partial [Labilithrix sp.]|nr:thiamine pyrophosphate-dependent enzyme [Labilithrix sp.]